jgi:hypothetical protein
VSIEPVLGGGLYFKLRRATTRIDDALVGQEFHGSPEELAELAAADSATRIRIYGRALWDRLSEHQAVNAALTTVLGVPNGQVSPIYFELLDRRAERFHWETLCDNHDRFLALDRRWPIGRIAEPNRDLPSVRDFAPPLRVMAVLSALGARGEQEWNAILTAVRDSLGGPVPLRVHVLVSEPALYEQIRPLAAADVRDRPVDGGTHSWLSASVVPDRDVDLLREIDVFAPHVLHVFCHGSAAHEQPQLEFAAPLDWEDRPPTGSVVVTVDELANRPALTSMLLVVLNCCEGATPTQDVHSLAASLVANGLPAAVGMREPVDVLAAYEFSRSFYARPPRYPNGWVVPIRAPASWWTSTGPC